MHHALRGVYVAAYCGVCVGIVLVFRDHPLPTNRYVAQGVAVVSGAPEEVASTPRDLRGAVLTRLDLTFRMQEEELARHGEPYLVADLGVGLSLKRGTTTLRTYRMLTVGGEEPWRSVAPGVYSVVGKQTDRAVGGAHYPWSISFSGWCAFHGWPYDASGTPLQAAAAGGCVRLATSDARELFGEVTVGTPVIVRAATKLATSTPTVGSTFAPPQEARAYLAVDLASGYVFAGATTTRAFPIASLTKLMTALVALENLPLDEQMVVSAAAIVYTSKPRFHAGESVRGYDLLGPLLGESSNEAAFTLAESVGRDAFTGLMESRRASLGLGDTSFVDPAGSGAENVSSAEDLAVLLRYLLTYRPQALAVTAGRGVPAFGTSTIHDLGNFNHFAAYPAFIGGKTGKTNAARETMVAVFELRVGTVVRPVACIVLGTSDARGFIEALRKYIVGLTEREEGA